MANETIITRQNETVDMVSHRLYGTTVMTESEKGVKTGTEVAGSFICEDQQEVDAFTLMEEDDTAEDEPKTISASGKVLLSKVTEMLSRDNKKQEPRLKALEAASLELASAFADAQTELSAAETKIEELETSSKTKDEELIKLTERLDELEGSLSHTPSKDHQKRPASTGGGKYNAVDF